MVHRKRMWPALLLVFALVLGSFVPRVSQAESVKTPVQAQEGQQGGETPQPVSPEKEISDLPVEGSESKLQKAPQKAPANGAQGKVYFEIMPDIFVKQGGGTSKDVLFSSPEETVGVLRSSVLYGGPLPESVLEGWKKLAFFVYDENGTQIDRATGTIGDKGRWSSTKYLGPYDKGQVYSIKVDPSTLPNYYHSWMSKVEDDHFPNDPLDVEGNDCQTAIYNKKHEELKADYAFVHFHMDVVSFLFAKDEEVAKGKFTLDGAGKPTGWNTGYTKGSDYVLKPISKEGKVIFPSQEEMEKQAKEGYRPEGYYFYYTGKDGKDGKFKGTNNFKPSDGNYGYLRYWKDRQGINNTKIFNNSSVYTLILNQTIPKVTFDRNYEDAENPETTLESFEVFYKKSIANNCTEKEGCKRKTMPVSPKRKGWVFNGWNTKADGTGERFTKNTMVTEDLTVYAQWKKPDPSTPSSLAPVLEVEDKKVEKGDQSFSLRKAIVKAADTAGNDRKDEVQIVDDGGFDVQKVGSYFVKYRLTVDGKTIEKTAKIRVYDPDLDLPEGNEDLMPRPPYDLTPDWGKKATPVTREEYEKLTSGIVELPSSDTSVKPEEATIKVVAKEQESSTTAPETGDISLNQVASAGILAAAWALAMLKKRKPEDQ